MNINIEKHDLIPVWGDVNEALEIMKGFSEGEIRQSDAKRIAKNGCRRLSRAKKTLGKIAGMHDE